MRPDDIRKARLDRAEFSFCLSFLSCLLSMDKLSLLQIDNFVKHPPTFSSDWLILPLTFAHCSARMRPS